jgi:hypothetical protein
LYERLLTNLKWCKPSWKQLISVTTDRLPNLTGKNLGLLKRVQDSFCEICPN